MGIPSYFRKILEDHPNTHFWKDDMYVDNLLIDFNSIVYQVINLLNLELGDELSSIGPITYENKLVNRIIKYLQHIICEVIKPRKIVYIAVDGVPPFAKMIQQRARRYKLIKEQNFKSSLEKKYKIVIPTLQWNKSAISPGTSFMVKLSKIIIQNIQLKNFQIHNDKLIVIFNDDSVPSEGEHKLLPNIRRIKPQSNEVSVVYSPDADLIVLMIISGINNIFILREPRNSEIENKFYKNHEFLYLNIDKCREEFSKQMINNFDFKIPPENYKEILRDYSFLTFLCGNDFVIAAPFLKMKEGGIEILINAHQNIFKELNPGPGPGPGPNHLVNSGIPFTSFQFLINSNYEINNLFLFKLINYLADIEEEKLKKWQKKRDKIRQGIRSSKREITEQNKKPWELELIRFSHEEYYSPLHPHYEYLNKVFDRIDYFTSDWNQQYNKHFFGSNDIFLICHNYYKSLVFCLKYYYEGVPSWKWFYKYRAAPSMRDFANYIQKNINNLQIEWDLSTPYTQFEQLMYILPKQSFKLLPKVLQDDYTLSEFYPKNFVLDIVQGQKHIYSDPILPEIPMEIIQNKIKSLQNQFNELEKERNTLRTKPYIYKPK